MTRPDPETQSQEQRQSALAPETHNDEQDDHRAQAQQLSAEARSRAGVADSPTESAKEARDGDPVGGSEQDLIDHMRDMESSGRIDMSAYRGEDNHDDNEDRYGKAAKPDPDLPSDGS